MNTATYKLCTLLYGCRTLQLSQRFRADRIRMLLILQRPDGLDRGQEDVRAEGVALGRHRD